MRRADIFRDFFTAAVERFRGTGANEELFYLLLGGALASFPEHRRELETRLRIVGEIIHRLRGRVLDVGCGTGIFSLLFATAPGVREVVGIDTVDRFHTAGDVASQRGLPVEFVRTDFLEYSPGESFDAVIFLWMLHDVGDPGPYLERALGHLREGGVVLVGDVDRGGMLRAIGDFARRKGLSVAVEEHGEVLSHGRMARAFLAELRRG